MNTVTLQQQQLSGFETGQQYTLSYAENARNNNQPLLQVVMDGNIIVAQHKDPSVGGTNPFRVVASNPFTVSTSTPLLQFIASQLNSGEDRRRKGA